MFETNKCESNVFAFWLLIYNFTTILQMASLPLKRKQFLRIFEKLHRVDLKFKKLKLNFTCKYVHAFTLIIQITAITLLLVLIMCFVRKRSILLLVNILGIFSFVLREFFIGFFVVLIAVVYVRLDFLQKYAKRAENSRKDFVDVVANIHFGLTEAIENLNSVLGIAIVGKLATLFFLMILFLLNLFDAKENCYLHFLLWLTFQGITASFLFVFAEIIQNKVCFSKQRDYVCFLIVILLIEG